MYEVKLELFQGPLHKLLELIEEKKLEITQVSLGAVTEDFIHYVEGLGQSVDSDILADFVVVASRLLLIKSKILLPSLELTQEEETDIRDLEYRLKIYREFKLAGEYVKSMWDKNAVSFSRPLLASLGERSFFYPPKDIGAANIHKAMHSLLTLLQGLLPETKRIKIKVVTLQEKIAELAQRLEQAATHNFRSLATNRSRTEVIVLFLAVLHMLANRLMAADQGEQFGDIVITKNGKERGSTSFAMGVPTA